MYIDFMQEITATSFRKRLFKVLEHTAKAFPTRVRYKKGDSVLMSYRQYLDLTSRPTQSSRMKRGKGKEGLSPLVRGRILKPLGKESERELLDYMGIK